MISPGEHCAKLSKHSSLDVPFNLSPEAFSGPDVGRVKFHGRQAREVARLNGLKLRSQEKRLPLKDSRPTKYEMAVCGVVGIPGLIKIQEIHTS